MSSFSYLLVILISAITTILLNLLTFSTASPVPFGFESLFESIQSVGEAGNDQNDSINYLLYNSSGKTLDEQLVKLKTDGSVPKTMWNFGGALKVIVHGYHADYTYSNMDHIDDHRMQKIAEAYAAANSSVNIILVDWSMISMRVNYAEAAENIVPAGITVATYLMALKKFGAFDNWDDLHLIGFSLGCHMSGVVGQYVQEFTKGQFKIGRITGLDPAGPMFDENGEKLPNDTSRFLDHSDASFVDIIHCNMGDEVHWSLALRNGRLGSKVQAGHADFYPNGGVTQTFQCPDSLDDAGGCSHRCCVPFFAASITRSFLSCACASWEDFRDKRCTCDETTGDNLGDKCSTKASGKYYLKIKDKLDEGDITKGPPQVKSMPEQSVKSVATRLKKEHAMRADNLKNKPHEVSSGTNSLSSDNLLTRHSGTSLNSAPLGLPGIQSIFQGR